MHVLFLPSWYPETADDFGGSFFREQAEAFIAEGHQVGVLAVRGFPVYQATAMQARNTGVAHANENGVNVTRTDVLLPVPKLHALNLKVLERRWTALFEEYVAVHGAPDVLHAHAMLPAGIVASRISERTGIPFLITEHRPSSMTLMKSPGYHRSAMKAVRNAIALVGVARGFAEELNEAYRTDKWHYLPGLLSPQFEDIPTRDVPTGPFVFGHVSHLDPGKRVDLLIESFGKAFANDDSVRLRIAGGSAHKAALEAQVEQLGLTNVDLVGAVPREHIVEEFSRANVFVLTSEKEAFGTVLWEAMACGLPILSTDTWAGKNAVTPETGIMTPVDDGDQLAENLKRMYAEFPKYDSARIREICVEHCGQEVFVRQYIDIYESGAAQ